MPHTPEVVVKRRQRRRAIRDYITIDDRCVAARCTNAAAVARRAAHAPSNALCTASSPHTRPDSCSLDACRRRSRSCSRERDRKRQRDARSDRPFARPVGTHAPLGECVGAREVLMGTLLACRCWAPLVGSTTSLLRAASVAGWWFVLFCSFLWLLPSACLSEARLFARSDRSRSRERSRRDGRRRSRSRSRDRARRSRS